MSKQKAGIPGGTRDFGPQEMAKRNYLLDTIKAVYRKYGFEPLETPAMENLSVLMGKYGEEGDQLLYKILNSGDFLGKATAEDFSRGSQHMLGKVTKKGLRYDLTVPFARYVAMNRGTLSFPFKRYQIQPVWRADRPQKGRYREFFQCDADVIGTSSLLCEAEIVAMLTEVFQKFELQQYVIKINNRKVLAGIAEATGAPGKEAELCVAIDKLDKIGVERVSQELRGRGFGEQAVNSLQPLFSLQGSNKEKMALLAQMLKDSETGRDGLAELQTVFNYVELLDMADGRLEFDATLARGLSYYTGAIFEVKATGVSIGSISGGGRYDNLTGTFGFPDMSGVGISFGIDRIYDVLEELKLFPDEQLFTTQVLFINFDTSSERFCLPLLQRLRARGINAELYPEAAKMKKQMTWANRKQIPFVVLAGENEIAAGKVTLKNMQSGEQQQLAPAELLDTLAPPP